MAAAGGLLDPLDDPDARRSYSCCSSERARSREKAWSSEDEATGEKTTPLDADRGWGRIFVLSMAVGVLDRSRTLEKCGSLSSDVDADLERWPMRDIGLVLLDRIVFELCVRFTGSGCGVGALKALGVLLPTGDGTNGGQSLGSTGVCNAASMGVRMEEDEGRQR
ncbi:hypothetical protein HYQ46_001426 [Verticillium longisporum]|nr:hypothetical protein HYQ46_001426 [Verticillium longisporum]